MSVNVYCKGARHGGHMSASSAILLMKYYDDNNTYLNFRCNIWVPADGTAVALLDQLILHSSNNSWSITKLALEYSVVDVEDRDRGKYQHSNNDSICTYDVTCTNKQTPNITAKDFFAWLDQMTRTDQLKGPMVWWHETEREQAYYY